MTVVAIFVNYDCILLILLWEVVALFLHLENKDMLFVFFFHFFDFIEECILGTKVMVCPKSV